MRSRIQLHHDENEAEDALSLSAGHAYAQDSSGISETHSVISRPKFAIRHTASASCEFDTHSHTSFTVTTILSGGMTTRIGDALVELAAGATALTNIGQNHSASAKEVEFVSIGISPVLVNELIDEVGVIGTGGEIVFRETVVSDEAIAQLARDIANEITVEKPGRLAMVEAQVRQLVIHLLRSYLSVRKSAQIELSRAGLVDRRLRLAIEFMHDNFGRELSLEEVASVAFLSEYHFARLFKQITGLTPHVYLANVRLERARKLLAETTLSISEITSAVGYQSQSHFTKVFKSVTGITPRAYRESAKS